MEFSRQEYWSELLFTSPGDLPNPGIKPRSPAVQVYYRQFIELGKPFLLFRGSDPSWSREVRHSSGTAGYVTDGPFLWRREDGTLLCLWSGFSEKGYAQGVAVSDNGDIDGRFSQADPLFLEDGGHGMLFRTLEGKVRLALHSPNTHLAERPVFIPVRM